MNTNRNISNGRYEKTHGMKNHPLYQTWRGMLNRCYKENRWDFKYYGGRGIVVCDEWHNVHNFIEWAENNGWENGLTIDRIDNNGNYEPLNCRFASHLSQMRNSRQSKISIEIARSIRKECNARNNLEYQRLGEKYGISISTVGMIVRNQLWKDE